MRLPSRLLGLIPLILLIAALLSCHRQSNHPAPAARIIIDAQDVTGEIDPDIYSHFIENLGMCIYGGVWEDDPKVPVIHGGIREDVVDLMKVIHPGVVRYPGGCFSDGYHFTDGIGTSRPIKPNLAWSYLNFLDPRIGPPDPNTFGTDEFIKFVREINAEPYININFGTGTVEEATAWVAYCNAGVANTTSIGVDSNGVDWKTAGDWALERQNNGSTQPYGVKYWGIANEIYGAYEQGHTDSTSYGNRFIEFHNKMKAVDPGIKLVAVGSDETWNKTVLNIAWEYIDYLSIHAYYSGVFESAVSGVKDTEEDFYSILSAPIVLENYIKSAGETIKEVTGSNDLKIALDEWNLWWNYQQLIHSEYSLRDGLFAALVFNVLHRNANIVGMANLAQMVNTIGMLNTSETDILQRPFITYSSYTQSMRLGLP
jgi:alpha-N-arabinofuranosidase